MGRRRGKKRLKVGTTRWFEATGENGEPQPRRYKCTIVKQASSPPKSYQVDFDEDVMNLLRTLNKLPAIVPRSRLKLHEHRRRLGWKPSHDIPRRREGLHPLINRVLRESERQS